MEWNLENDRPIWTQLNEQLRHQHRQDAPGRTAQGQD